MPNSMSSPRIATAFAEAKAQDRMAFIPFVTAGDPDLETTLAVISTLADRGADVIEVGFPYSDPIADGPVIQASYTRALSQKVSIPQILKAVQTLAEEPIPPLVAMVSYSLIVCNGPDGFVKRLGEAGFSGMIVPDLPGDEADELAALVRSNGMDLIQLIAPTTRSERAERILQAASGFVYCLSVTGTTGERDQLPPQLHAQLSELRSKTNLPLAVGFGISRPDQVHSLRGLADGVIVGSALVRQWEQLTETPHQTEQILTQIRQFADAMMAAVKGQPQQPSR